MKCSQNSSLWSAKDSDQLWQSWNVSLSGRFQKLLLSPPRLSPVCSCTNQKHNLRTKVSLPTVMRSHQSFLFFFKALPSFHTLQHGDDFVILRDVFGDLGRSIDYVGTGVVPQQQQNNLLKGFNVKKKWNKPLSILSSLKGFQWGKEGETVESVTVIHIDKTLAERAAAYYDVESDREGRLSFSPFFQWRLLCAEVCHPCYSANSHQRRPANTFPQHEFQ